MKLGIVVGSTRQSRVTPRVAAWVEKTAKDSVSDSEWSLIDLAEYDLPMMTEPLPPMAGERPELSDGTKRYLRDMNDVDGFVFITPEYNHGIPAALKNAIDLLDYQLMRKPVAIVSHGSVGGARANEQLRLVVNSNLGGLPIPQSVTFYGRVPELIGEDGVLAEGNEGTQNALNDMVQSLVWHAHALKAARD